MYVSYLYARNATEPRWLLSRNLNPQERKIPNLNILVEFPTQGGHSRYP